jgi:hypothetical protein
MRVAICFWGLCRSTDKIQESIERCLYEPLRRAGILFDVYIHTYKLYHPYTNPRSKEYAVHIKNTNWKLVNPHTWKVEDQDTVDSKLELQTYRSHGNPWGDDETALGAVPYSTLDNHIRALYSLKEVTLLWSSSGVQYDAVIYARPDVRFLTKFQVEWLSLLTKRNMLIPDFQIYHGSNDRFAVGFPSVMRNYGERYYQAYGYSLQQSLHSERFLTDHMASRGIRLEVVPMRFQRVRADGKTCEADMNLSA